MSAHQAALEKLLSGQVAGMPRHAVITATGRSMVPTLVRGDRIHLELSGNGELRPIQVGQIVLARDVAGRLLIHRVVAITPRLLTRGDALEEDDPPIERVLALVIRIEPTWRSRLRRLYLRLRA